MLLLESVAALGVLMLFAVLVWRYPAQAAVLTFGAGIVLDCLQIGTSGFNLGVFVYPTDIVCGLLLVIGLTVVIKKREGPPRETWPVLILFGLAITNFLRGASDFGIKPAGNGARTLSYLLIPCLCFILVRPALKMPTRRMARWLVVVGLVLAAIALLRWAEIAPMPVGLADDMRSVTRALPSDPAMIIGQAFLGILFLQLRGRTTMIGVLLAGALGITMFFLQHRSVWIATGAGLVWFVISTIRKSTKSWVMFTGSAVVVFATLVPSYLAIKGVDGIASVAKVNFDEARAENNTWTWRLDGFAEAINRVFSNGPFEMLIGPPAGRELGSNASFASEHIHDRYIDTLAYYGLFGVAILLIWVLKIIRKVNACARRRSDAKDAVLDQAFLQALLLSQLIYFVPYFGGIMQGAMLALIWMAASFRPSRSRCPLTSPVFRRIPRPNRISFKLPVVPATGN